MSTDLLARPVSLARRALNGPTMGSRWSAVFFCDDAADLPALGRALQASVDGVDGQMSTWKPDSDLSRLNGAPLGEWVPLPPQLTRVLAAALAIGRASGGAFDIGVGDLVRAWGFGGGSRTPDASRIAAVAGRPALEPPKALQLDETGCRARKLAPLDIDLSGIAKGFGVDELARVMVEFGIRDWLVGIDGEMRAAGAKPDGRPWCIGHERPAIGSRDLAGVLELSGCAVATSGTYRHVAEHAGRRVSHTMDPLAGQPLDGDLASVTVLAGTCMEADAWATALLVAGAEGGLELARRMRVSALLVRVDGAVLSTF